MVGLIVSFLLGPNKLENMDTTLLSPCVRRWVDRLKARKALNVQQQTQTPSKGGMELSNLKLTKLKEPHA